MATKKVILQGRGQVDLKDRDYIASGGEGSVYKLGSTAIKIYTDPNKMRHDDMVKKIGLLSQLHHSGIAAPQNVVLDLKNNPIGYYMPFSTGEGLAKFFTNDYRKQVKFGVKQDKQLVEGMREIIQYAHSSGALVVDPNEYAWLITNSNSKGPIPTIVDVDSWQIGQFPAKVIIPSIRDYHAKSFSELTDWFSWGIVTFQLFTGIHPFKANLPGFGRYDFVAKMKANASVFDPKAKLNLTVRDFSNIPTKLLDWYEGVFRKGDRSIPPSPFDGGLSTSPRTTALRVSVGKHSGALKFAKLFSAPALDPIRKIFNCGVVLLESGALVNLTNSLILGNAVSLNTEVIKTEFGWVVLELQDGHLKAWFTSGHNDRTDLAINLASTGIFRQADRIFAISEQGLNELKLFNFKQPVLAVHRSWDLMINSTQFYDGVAVQDAFGSKFVAIPHDEDKLSFMRVAQLDEFKVVNAKALGRYAIFVGVNKAGESKKVELVFDQNFNWYSVQISDVDTLDLVLAILPRGVCASVEDDGELTVFVPSNGKVNKFKDSTISTAEPLANWDDKVLIHRANAIWHMSVV